MRVRFPRRGILPLCLILLLVGNACFAAGDAPSQQHAAQADPDTAVLLREIEQQITAGHAISPEHDNALETWQHVIERSTPASSVMLTTLADFVAHMRSRAAEERAAGTILWIDFEVFADTTDQFITHARQPPAGSAAPPAGREASVEERTPSGAAAPAPGITARDPRPIGAQGSYGAGSPELGAAAAASRAGSGNQAAGAAFPRPGAVDVAAVSPALATATMAQPAAVPAARRATGTASEQDPAAVAVYARRGDDMLAIKDISAARRFYEYAANAGSASAAAALARTLDPAFLAKLGVIGVRPDPALALDWYRKAATLGDRDARARLNALTTAAGTP